MVLERSSLVYLSRLLASGSQSVVARIVQSIEVVPLLVRHCIDLGEGSKQPPRQVDDEEL